MSEVENFIRVHEGQQLALLNYFHSIFTSELGLMDKIRFKIPFYYNKSWICYLNPIKGEGIELAFLRGNELSNDQGILNSKGRKQVYGIDFFQLDEIPERTVLEIVQEALILDETKPYPSKRKKH
jgi:hypothetical protein